MLKHIDLVESLMSNFLPVVVGPGGRWDKSLMGVGVGVGWGGGGGVEVGVGGPDYTDSRR
jgi:hypothetical protein